LRNLAADLRKVTDTETASFNFATDGTLPHGGYRVEECSGTVHFRGGDIAGLVHSICRFSRDVLGVDPRGNGTGCGPTRRSPVFDGLVLEAPPPRVANRSSTHAPLDPEAVIRFVETQVRPKVRNDGGDVTVGGVHDDTVRILAHADCATCVATDKCLKWWLERELSRMAGEPVRVVIEKRPPYFTRFP
jgi:Fe-S cluster biogenesis protein NfuA